jgi:predicted AAA+ superfamily ATPase
MEIITLLLLGRSEVLGKPPTFLENAFAGKIAEPFEIIIGDDLVHAMLVGGYPEMLRRKNQKRRRAWARDYIKAIVERGIRDLKFGDELLVPRIPSGTRIIVGVQQFSADEARYEIVSRAIAATGGS